jgi:hypothetical protein
MEPFQCPPCTTSFSNSAQKARSSNVAYLPLTKTASRQKYYYWELGLGEVGFAQLVSAWSYRRHHVYLHVYDTPEVTAPRGQSQRVSLYGDLLA